MASSINPPGRDQFGTYIRQSRFTEEELAMLHKEEQMMTAVLGGVLPEQPDTAGFKSVLDVGCGTGQWLIEVAQSHPETAHLVGVDINPQVVAYAQAQAVAQQVADRVQFLVMDAQGFLDLPPDTFDLINLRFGTSFLRSWDWNRLLHDFRRIARPNGVIRLIEADIMESNSSAQMQQADQLLQAFHRSGHAFTSQRDGMTSGLIPLLQQHGFKKVQTADFILHYRKESMEEQFLSTYLITHAFRSFQAFKQKWNPQPDDEVLTRQVLQDMERPDFEATWRFLTIWANNPPEKPI
jgi:ubiquinone/menaquinone biosynthesis C-methylase UbiE